VIFFHVLYFVCTVISSQLSFCRLTIFIFAWGPEMSYISLACEVGHKSFDFCRMHFEIYFLFLFAGEFLRSLINTRKLVLPVSMILCIILQLYRAAFLPHYQDYSDGGLGVWRHYFIEIWGSC
jgi:hypothetical protein